MTRWALWALWTSLACLGCGSTAPEECSGAACDASGSSAADASPDVETGAPDVYVSRDAGPQPPEVDDTGGSKATPDAGDGGSDGAQDVADTSATVDGFQSDAPSDAGSPCLGDGDGDGVCDHLDTCPGGADSEDGDDDGVCDYLDACPGGDDGADADGDGICDLHDPCQECAPAPAAAWEVPVGPWSAWDGRLQVYFTTPGTAPGGGEDPLLDDALIDLLETATTRVDLCLYELSYDGIAEAIVGAFERGVDVRFVGDGDEVDDHGYLVLADAGVPMRVRPAGDRIMHHKFAVIDERYVFTGSTNATNTGVLRNNNNSVILDSPPLAAAYTAEVEEMFEQQRFGSDKEGAWAQAPVTIGDTAVTVAFSPAGDPVGRVREALASADDSVYFMVFAFTHADIAADLIALHQAGVEVAGIFDESQAGGSASQDEALAAAGIPVLIDGNGNSSGFAGGKLHHKVMIIDAGTDSDPTVITGSFNWSFAAEGDNDENLLVLRGRSVVQPYLAELCARLDEAAPHPDNLAELPEPCARRLHRVRINEVLPRPDGGAEYVEVVNAGGSTVDLGGWTLGDGVEPHRHVFDAQLLSPGAGIVVSGAHLHLDDAGDVVQLRDAAGAIIDRVAWESAAAGIAFNRITDLADAGGFALHTDHGPASSPGAHADGSPLPPLNLSGVVFINELEAGAGGFIEVTNGSFVTVPTGDWRLELAGEVVHVFDTETTIAPGGALAVSPPLPPGGTLILRDGAGQVVDQVSWEPGAEGSLNRARDGVADAPLVPHHLVPGAFTNRSPGARVTGAPWGEPSPPALVLLNELLPNPSGSDSGQEMVEIVNAGATSVNLAAWTLGDAASPERHRFPIGAWLAPGAAIVVFDSGDHPEVPSAKLASTGLLSLNNSSETVTLRRPDGSVADQVSWSSSAEGVSWCRAVDGDPDSPWVRHDTIEGAAGSHTPGTRADGSEF